MTAARRSTPLRPVLAGLLLAMIAVLAMGSPAGAHAILVSSNPVQGSTVPTAPPQVVLTFTEPVTAVPGKVRVIAPDNTRADSGEPRVTGDQLIIPVRQDGPKGTYLVSFRVISADSHPVAGAFTYSVVVSSTPPVTDQPTGAASPVISALFPIVRWVGYAGLVLLVGSVLVLAMLWPQRLSRTGPTRLIWLGAALVAAATVAEVAVQVPYIAGGFGQVGGSDIQEVLSSQFGVAHLVRLGVLGAALVLLRPMLQGRGWGADRALLAVLGALGIATWSVSGHPFATSIPIMTVVADMIHVAAMSVWIGGLVMLALFLLPRATESELGAIVPVWSRWAMYAVAALLVTGVAQALVEIGSVAPLFSTTYGWLVLTKVVLLGLVLLAANASRRLVGPIMQRSSGVAGRLRMLVAAEAAGAAVIIAVASVLVQTTPARGAPQSSAPPTVQSAVLVDPLFTLAVDDSPAKVGVNELHMFATTPQGGPADIKEWQVKASLPSAQIEPIEVAVLSIQGDHAIGQVALPRAGTWTFTFTLRTSEIDQSTVRTTFVVSN